MSTTRLERPGGRDSKGVRVRDGAGALVLDPASVAVVDWLARVGAGSVADLSCVTGLSPRVTQDRLRALESAGQTRSLQLLHGVPALHALTRRGLRAAGRSELDPVAISASGFGHLVAVARVAVALRQTGCRVGGERELRAWERIEARPLASAEIGVAPDGTIARHRPDLVCWEALMPIAIEVELTVKAPERLAAIVRGWARSRLVGGVVYYCTPSVTRALTRAVRSESADDRVAVLPLDRAGDLGRFRSTSSIPSAA